MLMRDILADSDSRIDPQVYVLRPDVVLEISEEIVKKKTITTGLKKRLL